MPRTKASALKRLKTIKEKYGDQILADWGAVGGKAKVPTKGFGTTKRKK